MGTKPAVVVEPLTFALTGFKVDDLVSSKFLEELKKAHPSGAVVAVVIGFTDTKEIVSISHDRDHDSGKFKFERVDVEGTEAKSVADMKEVLLKVFG
jgi:hypothetical protein